MKLLDLCASLSLVTLAACAGTAASEQSLPCELKPAAASSSLRLAARGVQIYECRTAPDPYSPAQWTLVAPEAELFDVGGQRVGRHFAGPHWEATDGSRIVSSVTQVLRINTVGGVAPATACSPGVPGGRVSVPYSADYVLFTD